MTDLEMLQEARERFGSDGGEIWDAFTFAIDCLIFPDRTNQNYLTSRAILMTVLSRPAA